jgi:hypothetical protein
LELLEMKTSVKVPMQVDGGYGALSAEGMGENSSFAGCSQKDTENSTE